METLTAFSLSCFLCHSFVCQNTCCRSPDLYMASRQTELVEAWQKPPYCRNPNAYRYPMSFQYRYAQAILGSPLTRYHWCIANWHSYGADRDSVSSLDHSFPATRKSAELRNLVSADVPLDQHRHIPDSLCSKNSHSIAGFVFAFL